MPTDDHDLQEIADLVNESGADEAKEIIEITDGPLLLISLILYGTRDIS